MATDETRMSTSGMQRGMSDAEFRRAMLIGLGLGLVMFFGVFVLALLAL